ncbi:MAG TPA: RHS repeat-associated core domain-containing protein, partial [Candidatus Angelobacter sp.]
SKGVPPTGSLTLSPNNPPTLAAGQTQTFTVQASDASGAAVPNVGVALIINGANMQQLSATTDVTGRAIFSYSAANAGTDSLQAVGNISGLGAFSNTVNVNWTVPAGGGGGGTTVVAQQGWIGQPLSGLVTQGQVPITVASGISLTSGTLKYWPTANPADVHVINGNTTGSGTIGVFDGTALANGGYTIQLQATASNGTQQTSLIVVSVIGDNKPGHVTFNTTDLRIPVGGLPVAITRSYDSLNKGKSGDFGFGWSLSTGVDLQVDAANNVSFTLNGQRRTFFFQALPSSFLFPWLLLPKYVPQAGLHGTLTSDGCGALLQVQGSQFCFPTGPYQPTTYTYTDPQGRVFVISANGQIRSITDTNGNILTFGANGVTSSAGSINLPFLRDNQGRITKITDLNGGIYSYAYDAAGNLSAVTFPGTSNPATYAYDATHLLTGKTDPRGNSTTTAYGADGRLQSITDAQGNVTRYSYNLATNTTTTTHPDGGVTVQVNNSFGKPVSITDPLNRTTTFTYDANQNLLTQTDPLGGITTYTYDANGNQTSVKDPLGNTSRKTYNQFGGVTSSTDALNSNTITITTNASFNPVQWSDSLGQFMAATYDASGNPLTVTNANGKVTQFSYDSRGNLAQVTDALNRIMSNTYNAMDLQLSHTDARGKVTSYTYDAMGRLSSQTDANNQVTRYTYDDNGNKTSATDPLGRVTSYTFDSLNRLSKVTYPDSTFAQYTYDFRGNKLTDTDQLQRVTKYVYDLAGQLTSVTFAFGTPDAATIFYTYDKNGRKTSDTDGRGNHTTYGYDAAGRLITVTDALGRIITYGYDADNRRTSIKDPNQHTTTFAYDARGRMVTVKYNDLTTTSYTHDGAGNQLTMTDQAGLVTSKSFDAVGHLVSVIDALQQVTQYTYDPSDNLATVTDANQHVTSFQYDNLSRRIRHTLPLGMFETSSYDAAGNLLASTDFNGKTTTYTYDAMNRLLSKQPDPSLNQPVISFTYTLTGQRASMTDASGITAYTYDNRDRLSSKSTPAGTLTYTHDAAGNVLTINSSNANGASLAYSYDADNRLSSVIDNRLLAHGAPSGVTSYSYDPAGNLLSYNYPNAVQTSQVYDALNRITQLSSVKGAPLSTFNYTIGAAGNRLSASELGGRSVSYTYDSDYRLTSESISGAPAGGNGSISYTYDLSGNRLQKSSTVSAIPGGVSAYDANDQLTSDSYDANGNTIASGGVSNVYDFENNLVRSGSVSVVYDGDGNRVAETAGGVTTRFLIDDLNPTGYSQVMDELSSGFVSRTHAYGLGHISQNQLIGGVWTPSFYGYDAHGSVRFLANLAGSVSDTYQFDAFGSSVARTGTTPNNYLYSGEPLDNNTGLYQLRARWYQPATGRFMTRDSQDGVQCFPGSFSPYLYTSGDPVNMIDPTGHTAAVETAELNGLLLLGGVIITLFILGRQIACVLSVVASVLYGVALYAGNIESIQLNFNTCSAEVTPGKPRCNPCIPPVGTIAYRLDLPPSPPHRGVPAPHWHLYVMSQNPNNCQCFWSDIPDNRGGFGSGPPPPGSVPIGPAGGGGFAP